jgi:hypothetical protein
MGLKYIWEDPTIWPKQEEIRSARIEDMLKWVLGDYTSQNIRRCQASLGARLDEYLEDLLHKESLPFDKVQALFAARFAMLSDLWLKLIDFIEKRDDLAKFIKKRQQVEDSLRALVQRVFLWLALGMMPTLIQLPPGISIPEETAPFITIAVNSFADTESLLQQFKELVMSHKQTLEKMLPSFSLGRPQRRDGQQAKMPFDRWQKKVKIYESYLESCRDVKKMVVNARLGTEFYAEKKGLEHHIEDVRDLINSACCMIPLTQSEIIKLLRSTKKS